MRKLLLPFAGLVALSVLLGACDVQLSPYAARVDGSVIGPSTLDTAMASIASSSGYLCEFDPRSSLAISGTGGSSYSSAYAAVVLSELVQYRAASLEAARLGLRDSAFVQSLASTELPAQLTPSTTSGCTETGAAILASFSAAYRNQLLQFEADELLLLGHLAGVTLTSQGLAAYEASHKAASTESCTSVIEVAKKATAVAARTQVLAGASFASVARADSLDSASAAKGGAIGCFFASQFTAPLSTDVAGLPVGHVSPPISFNGGYLLLLVTKRPLAPLVQVASSIVLAEQSQLTGLLAQTLSAAHVTVDPRYGSWQHASTGWRVVAASGPRDALLPNPGAVTPSPPVG